MAKLETNYGWKELNSMKLMGGKKAHVCLQFAHTFVAFNCTLILKQGPASALCSPEIVFYYVIFKSGSLWRIEASFRISVHRCQCIQLYITFSLNTSCFVLLLCSFHQFINILLHSHLRYFPSIQPQGGRSCCLHRKTWTR